MTARLDPDRDSAPWWEAVDRGELLLQRCTACGVPRFPARALCNRCRSRDSDWIPARGTGAVYSWIVNHQRFMPNLPVPYAVVCVRLDEGEDILMYGNLVDEAGNAADPATLVPGLRLRAVLIDGLVQWTPAE
ncbi:Zn-ribbon domain-containing OB-fold protein [Actinocorallia sp. A-T 12471]|uniref:Zn-ribbon domain-containing OB-fold protein n=1 Tax=Actinocorallia sp. A-T 12471 TaxID=3089813 RepID=UPI0029CE1022|nr:zinc ribbon domain-containing protein [Actinocorallia sp. A-T 12471]MDX6743397.1 zinc ribbon domain-containing protein [Actinocorallia sp. A-T 12471]